MIAISVNQTGASRAIQLPASRYKRGLGLYLVRRSGLSKIADDLTQEVQRDLLTVRTVMVSHGVEADFQRVEAGMGQVRNGLSTLILHFADAMLVITASGLIAVSYQLTLTHMIGGRASSNNWIIALAELIAIGGICGIACYIPHKLAFPLAMFSIMKLIHEIETDESAWADVGRRTDWSARLDRIADRWISIGELFAIKGKRRDEGISKAFAEITAGIRSRVLWLVSPRENTRQELLAYLVRLLSAALSGNWHCLRENAEQPKRPVRECIASTCRMAALGTLPLVGVVLCRHEFPSLLIPVSVQAALCIVWPLAVIMTALGKELKAAIETFKDFISMFKATLDNKQ